MSDKQRCDGGRAMNIITDEMVEAATQAACNRGDAPGCISWAAMSDATKEEWRLDIRAALAAVAPLIAQAEREACARVAMQAYAVCDCPMHARMAAAIRARSTEEKQ